MEIALDILIAVSVPCWLVFLAGVGLFASKYW
jgi:hypothetical protein